MSNINRRADIQSVGIVKIANGASTVAVTFQSAGQSSPVVQALVAKGASADANISVASIYGVTSKGFTAVLSGTTGNANYTLHWTAC